MVFLSVFLSSTITFSTFSQDITEEIIIAQYNGPPITSISYTFSTIIFLGGSSPATSDYKQSFKTTNAGANSEGQVAMTSLHVLLKTIDANVQFRIYKSDIDDVSEENLIYTHPDNTPRTTYTFSTPLFLDTGAIYTFRFELYSTSSSIALGTIYPQQYTYPDGNISFKGGKGYSIYSPMILKNKYGASFTIEGTGVFLEQTIDFNIEDDTTYSPVLSLDASVSSGGKVSYRTSDERIAFIRNDSLIFNTSGTVIVEAYRDYDQNYISVFKKDTVTYRLPNGISKIKISNGESSKFYLFNEYRENGTNQIYSRAAGYPSGNAFYHKALGIGLSDLLIANQNTSDKLELSYHIVNQSLAQIDSLQSHTTSDHLYISGLTEGSTYLEVKYQGNS